MNQTTRENAMRFVWALLLTLTALPAALAQDHPVRNVTFIVATGAGAAV